MPKRDPIPQGNPDQLRLESAEPLVDLGSIPAGAEIVINAQRTYEDTTVEALSFLKSWASADVINGEVGSFLVRDGEYLSPVVLLGACTPGAVYPARGVVKAGFGFSYVEMATFRSSKDAPARLLERELPPPESLDPNFLMMCAQIGQVVVGIDERLYWQMPVNYCETGPVQSVKWSAVGFGSFFTRGGVV